jgi:hypothetical protein
MHTLQQINTGIPATIKYKLKNKMKRIDFSMNRQPHFDSYRSHSSGNIEISQTRPFCVQAFNTWNLLPQNETILCG